MNLDIYQEQILRTAGLVIFHPLREDLLDVYGVNHLIAADVCQGLGAFTSDTGWVKGTGWTIGSGVASFNHATGNTLSRTINVVVGKIHRVTFDITARSSGQVRPLVGSGGVGTYVSAIGPHEQTIVCSGSTTFAMQTDNGANLSIDNVVCREIYSGTFTGGGCLFDGLGNCLQTTNPVALGTDKVTVLFDWYPNVYDLVNNEVMVEMSPNFTLANNSLIIYAGGADANDPLVVGARGSGSNYNTAQYNAATFGWGTPAWHTLAYTHDMALASNEANLILNGSLATPSSRLNNANLSGNFGDYNIYLGGRGGVSIFGNHTKRDFAIYNRILSESELTALFHAKSMRRGVWGRSIGKGLIS